MENSIDATSSADQFPSSCCYKETMLQGHPCHQEFDVFWCRHSPMDTVHRAKTFSPFNALRGLDEALWEQEKLAEAGRLDDTSSPDSLFLQQEFPKDHFLNPLPPDVEDQLP